MPWKTCIEISSVLYKPVHSMFAVIFLGKSFNESIVQPVPLATETFKCTVFFRCWIVNIKIIQRGAKSRMELISPFTPIIRGQSWEQEVAYTEPCMFVMKNREISSVCCLRHPCEAICHPACGSALLERSTENLSVC